MTANAAAMFGAGVRARRQMLSMTQQDLADAVGTDNVQISRIENARIVTSLATAATIADALDTTVSALLGERCTHAVEIAAALGAVGKAMTDAASWLAERDR